MSAPKLDVNNRFAVLGAPDSEDEDEDEEYQDEAEFHEQDAEEAAASLDDLGDKPKAPTSAATVEEIVSSLLDDSIGALELDEMRLEVKFQLEDLKLLDIKDKVQADTALKVP